MKSIGYGGYTCIDVNQRYGALQMDLNTYWRRNTSSVTSSIS